MKRVIDVGAPWLGSTLILAFAVAATVRLSPQLRFTAEPEKRPVMFFSPEQEPIVEQGVVVWLEKRNRRGKWERVNAIQLRLADIQVGEKYQRLTLHMSGEFKNPDQVCRLGGLFGGRIFGYKTSPVAVMGMLHERLLAELNALKR